MNSKKQNQSKKERQEIIEQAARQEKIERLRTAMITIKQARNLLTSPVYITAEYLGVKTETVYGWLTPTRNAIPKFKLQAIENYANEVVGEYNVKHDNEFELTLDKPVNDDTIEEEW